MSDINWKEGAVCYFAKKQWFPNNGALGGMLKGYIHHYNYGDFQLNEIREGDFTPASELDTEQKYNEVVEVFGLFGFKRFYNASYADTIKAKTDSSCLKVNPSGELICNWHKGDRQLTYHQIIAIGKLKRMMLERERSKVGYFDEIPDNTSEFDAIVSSKSVGMSEPKKSVNVVMTNKTAAIKVLEALGMDSSFVQSVSINGKEVFNIENADDITTVTVSKYVKKT